MDVSHGAPRTSLDAAIQAVSLWRGSGVVEGPPGSEAGAGGTSQQTGLSPVAASLVPHVPPGSPNMQRQGSATPPGKGPSPVLTPTKSALHKRHLAERPSSVQSTRRAHFASTDGDGDEGSGGGLGDEDGVSDGGHSSTFFDEVPDGAESPASNRSTRSGKSVRMGGASVRVLTSDGPGGTSRHSLKERLQRNSRALSGRSVLNSHKDIWLWLPLPLQLQLSAGLPSLQHTFDPRVHMSVGGEPLMASQQGVVWHATLLRLAKGATREEVTEALAKRHELHVSVCGHLLPRSLPLLKGLVATVVVHDVGYCAHGRGMLLRGDAVAWLCAPNCMLAADSPVAPWPLHTWHRLHTVPVCLQPAVEGLPYSADELKNRELLSALAARLGLVPS